jgi:glucan phosphoethanolaminetransferase (alkaline phosphatase superfamily)
MHYLFFLSTRERTFWVLRVVIILSVLYFPIGWFYGYPNVSLIASLYESDLKEAAGFFESYEW